MRQIVVLSDGVVAEQGAPDALYARNGQYTHMVDLQTEARAGSSDPIQKQPFGTTKKDIYSKE